MVRSLLVRGMAAGLVAGVLAFVFARLFGEASVDAAIAYEDAAAAAAGEPPGPELVSRGVQGGAGLLVALLVYGVAVGGILALVHAATLGRLGALGPRGGAVVVTLVGFVAAVVVPFVKYPPNPPAASAGETIGTRTGSYVAMLAASIVLATAALGLARRLSRRLGWWNAVLAGAAGYLLGVGVVGALLPRIAETPADFPAAVLADFRLASFGVHLVLWTAFAVVFAELVHRMRAAPVGARRPFRDVRHGT